MAWYPYDNSAVWDKLVKFIEGRNRQFYTAYGFDPERIPHTYNGNGVLMLNFPPNFINDVLAS